MTIINNDILPVLGLNSGYTVEYSPPLLGVPSGCALRNSLWQRAIFGLYPLSCPKMETEHSCAPDLPNNIALLLYYRIFMVFEEALFLVCPPSPPPTFI